MVNPLKVLVAISLLFLIIGIFFLGKRLRFFFDFSRIRIKKSESFWILLVSIILVLFTAFTEHFRFEAKVSVFSVVGFFLFFLAVVLQFFVVKQNSVVSVKKEMKNPFGLYKKIRFPGYSSLSLLVLSLCLVFSSVWAVMMFLVLYLPALFYRISQEETVLSDIDENEFALYSSETKKIVPGVF
jgi:protein-S-isoprenylcysteine O-methyltransferase Ste14